jgi:hypothetical protein
MGAYTEHKIKAALGNDESKLYYLGGRRIAGPQIRHSTRPNIYQSLLLIHAFHAAR